MVSGADASEDAGQRRVAAAGETLTRCFEPCLVYVLAILDQAGVSDVEKRDGAGESEVRHEIVFRLDGAASRAAAGFAARSVLLARRLATAWIDERLASDDWPGRGIWRARPLQSDWGEGRTAGEWFFETVENLEPSRSDNLPLAGLALRCLALGLDGRMHRSPAELAELRRRTAARFGLARRPEPFPPPLPDAAAMPGKKRKRRVWLLPLVVLAGLFLARWLGDLSLERYLESRLPTTASSPSQRTRP